MAPRLENMKLRGRQAAGRVVFVYSGAEPAPCRSKSCVFQHIFTHKILDLLGCYFSLINKVSIFNILFDFLDTRFSGRICKCSIILE